jgi:hypothetical protein
MGISSFCIPGGMFTPSFTPRCEHSLLFRKMEEWTEGLQLKGINLPKGFVVHPWGSTFTLGANFTPGCQLNPWVPTSPLGANLKTGLWTNSTKVRIECHDFEVPKSSSTSIDVIIICRLNLRFEYKLKALWLTTQKTQDLTCTKCWYLARVTCSRPAILWLLCVHSKDRLPSNLCCNQLSFTSRFLCQQRTLLSSVYCFPNCLFLWLRRQHYFSPVERARTLYPLDGEKTTDRTFDKRGQTFLYSAILDCTNPM